MQVFYKIILFSALFVCLGCPDQDDPVDAVISIRNNSDHDLVYFLEYRLPQDDALPQFSLFPSEENIEAALITSNSTVELAGSWNSLFKNLPDKEIKIFLFSGQVIESTPWKQVVNQNLVLRRYDLTRKQLMDLNWIVEYP